MKAHAIATAFNPAGVSIAAKKWECLRRNDQYRGVLAFVSDQSQGTKSRRERVESERRDALGRNNPYVAALMELILGERDGTPGKGKCGHALRPELGDPSKSWTELSNETKALFEKISDVRFVSTPSIVSGQMPDGEEYPLWAFSFIAVPRYSSLLNGKNMAKEVVKLIPKHDYRRFGSGGGKFGSVLDWKVFLSFEYWRKNGDVREVAMIVAAYECFGHESRDTIMKDTATQRAKRTRHKRHSAAEKCVANIERCIASAYISAFSEVLG